MLLWVFIIVYCFCCYYSCYLSFSFRAEGDRGGKMRVWANEASFRALSDLGIGASRSYRQPHTPHVRDKEAVADCKF